MDLSAIKKVYISGIGGIGVSALARFLLAKNIAVVGSDALRSEITDKLNSLGINIFYHQEAQNVPHDADLFIYSAAVPETNPERVRARELKILQKSYFEMLGEITRDYKLVAVSGTNGKSTTTAMIAKIMVDAGLDPTVIVGSQFGELDVNFRLGNSPYFVL